MEIARINAIDARPDQREPPPKTAVKAIGDEGMPAQRRLVGKEDVVRLRCDPLGPPREVGLCDVSDGR
jgi:hypothetical protein